MNKLKRYLLFLVGLVIKSYLFPDVLYSENNEGRGGST